MAKLDAPEEQIESLTELLRQNLGMFAETDSQLSRTQSAEMSIDTGNNPPIRIKQYSASPSKRELINKAVDEMKSADAIRPSRSPWSFPVVIANKKDGTKRFCVDYRKLNDITKKSSWPLPRIDDIMTSFGKAKYFSVLDLKAGYWQIAKR